MEMGQAQVEHAIAEGESRIDERRPCLVAYLAVLGEAVLELECADRLGRLAEEYAINPRWAEVVAQSEKSALDIFDGWPTI
jgi:hypothetical protein